MTQAITPLTALLMTLPPLFWAGNAVVGRLMVGSVPPLTLNFLRWVIAAVILLALGWRVLQQPAALAARWRHLLWLGLLGVGAYNALQYLALVTSTPLNVTLVAASMPVWMLMVGALFFQVRPTSRQLVGAALALLGAVLVIARGQVTSLLLIKPVVGDLYVLIAVIAWAFYSWMLAKPPVLMRDPHRPTVTQDGVQRPWQWSELLLVQTLFGLLGAGAAAAGEQALGAQPMQWGPSTWLALAYIGIFPSVLAYRCWGAGIARGGPTLAAVFGNLTPVFAAIMSVIVLGEVPHWFHWAAFALIMGGIVYSTRGQPTQAQAKPHGGDPASH